MVMSTTNKVQIGPQNPDGIVVGGSATTPLAFFGGPPVLQPSAASQADLPQGASGLGNAGGAVSVYSSTQSPSSIATITVAEQSVTVTGLLATDLVLVNKPTSQAGIALCVGRVSAANTLKLSFGNATAGTLTPTGSEAYLVTAISVNLQVSQALTPAAVLANSVSEQQFTLTGTAAVIDSGMIIGVNKPTQQAGLGVMSARVVSKNVIAITFANFTAATLTPTAAETYLISGLNALAAVSNLIQFGVNVGTLSLIATVSSNEQSATEAGIAATDVMVGMTKPTHQTGLILTAGRVSGAGTIKVTFGNPTAGNLTPTGSEVYGVTVYRPSPGSLLSVFSATVTPASVAANTSAEQTFAVTGLVSAQPVIGVPQGNLSSAGAVAMGGIRASATNVVAITFVNLSAAAVVPPSLTWLIAQVNQTTPTAGNFVTLSVLPTNTAMANLLRALRSGAATLGLIAGS